MTALPQADPYRILVVCTGNICRSPFAEQLLRDSFARIGVAFADDTWADSVQVTSAGTHAMVGNAIEPAMAAFLEPYGSAALGHAARQLTGEHIADADLVLALTRDHRRDVVRMLPSASRQVFALNEFARLLEDARAANAIEIDSPATVQETMAVIADAAASRRGFTPALDDPGVDDVTDPYRRDSSVYAASAAQIAEIIGRIENAVLAALRAAE